ncbi:hypothetical protein PISS_a2292 [Pseudoalteromonas issachenkonii]|uniref:Uncharacterized protein n=1 Tax=Pseudoalteromonas issachenkonii TaxID=152297 RepID=A0ABM6N4E6_9GAMM|nr:hypothetical protein PISS_a2292 [Pseudoalteromonas issachenkonii]ATD03674.1 hypothetical protein PTET_a2329 [Pseudoalteromonas tetraodonis]
MNKKFKGKLTIVALVTILSKKNTKRNLKNHLLKLIKINCLP